MRSRLTSTSLLTLALLMISACAGDAPSVSSVPPKESITIGLNPAERSENVQQNARVLAEMIERRIGMPVQIHVAQDYSGLVEALRGRQVDFAFFAPVSYVFAEQIADARVLLKAERKGRPYYYSAIIVHADSAFRSLADLKGKTIAWVDPTSASGHIFPKAALIDGGIAPDDLFGQQIFAGGHDAVILSVINGTIAAGATYANDTLGESGSWTQLGEGAFQGKVRPIFFSPPIPGDNMATTQFMIDTYPEIVAKVTATVQGLTADSAGQTLMREMYHVDAMIPATSSDYDPVRRTIEMLDLDITGRIDPTGTRRNETTSTIVFSAAALIGIAALVVQTLRARRRRIVLQMASSQEHIPIDSDALFSIRDLSVIFADADGGRVTALDGVSLDIRSGEFVALIGPSGAGKSTFLRCLNRMNEPSAGRIVFDGSDITHVQGKALIALRRRIGFIFQQFNLVKNLSVLRNVLAGRLAHSPGLSSLLGIVPRTDVDLAVGYLQAVGLGEKLRSRADTLSGGQQQRVAIARALTQRPTVILADEPMASLDPKLAETVLQLLKRFNREEGITVIVSLHVLELARTYADRIVAFRGGRVAFDGPPDVLNSERIEEIYQTDPEAEHS